MVYARIEFPEADYALIVAAAKADGTGAMAPFIRRAVIEAARKALKNKADK